ncbi:MAG: gliding motility-associated C-terminal domain-containing protein [Saprospiraceae bacterium]|nr:gliding motility-associated C-terminal domain-containing protein [Saprospiraceae bacterium]
MANIILRYLLTGLLLVFFITISWGQVAKFTEVFDEANGATSGTSAEGISWNCNYIPCNFPSTGTQPAVNTGRFRDNNSDGRNVWTSGNINISQCQEIIFSVDYETPNQWVGSGSNNLEACNESGACACNIFSSCAGDCLSQWDFIYVELKLDGSIVYRDTIGIVATDSPTNYTFSYNSPCLTKGQYNNAVITIMTQTWASDEYIYFDNVSLSCYEFPAFSLVNPSPLCQSDPAVQLNVNPPGGLYSGGPYISPTGTFDPSIAGQGSHTVQYSFTQGSCTTDTSFQIEVNPITTPTFDQVYAQCEGGTNPLVNTSNEGITGSWSPAFDPNNTTLYTFTPDAGQCANTTTITVTINPIVTPTFNNIPPQCAGGTNPLVNTSNEGITGSWSPAFDPNNTTLYTFTPDAGQCANTTAITVTINPIVTPTFDAIPPQCAGGTNPLVNTSNEGITGLWSPAFDPNNTTLYTFTPDAGQCANTTTITVTINAVPVLDFPGGVNICEGTCQSIVLSVTEGSGDYSADLAIISPINYTIPTIVINGSVTFTICYQGNVPGFDAATNTLTVPPLLVPSGTNVTFALNNLVDNNTGCQGALSGGSNTSITVWANPTVSITPVSPLCSDDPPVTISGSPSGGTWTGPGVTGNTFDPAAAGPGSHEITYTYTDGNGCSGSAMMTIIVNNCACPNNTTVDAGQDLSACDGNPVNLSGNVTDGTGYYWQSGGTGTFSDPNNLNTTYTPSNDDITAGTVVISLIVPDPDGNGPCLQVSDQMTISFEESPEFTLTGNTPICTEGCGTILMDFTTGDGPYTGDITILIGADSYSYTVSNFAASNSLQFCYQNAPPSYDPGTNSFIIPLHPGQNQITILFENFTNTTNSCGAAQTQPINILISDPAVIDLSPLGQMCINDPPVTLQANPGNGMWSGDGTSNGTFDPLLAGLGIHVLTYTYTDPNGCSTSDTIQVEVLPCGCDNPASVNAGVDFIICPGDFANLLGSASGPATWTTSGTGTFDDINDPTTFYTPSSDDVAGGMITLTLTVADPDGTGPCTAVSDLLTLTFHTPMVTIDSISDLCLNSPIVTLSGSPSGGTFSGDGVIGNKFNPTLAGPGSHVIKYDVIDNSCPGQAQTTVIVKGKPLVTYNLPDTICLKDNPIVMSANPTGGNFTGNGVTGNQFYPDSAGVGSWNIVYSFSDTTGCSWTDTSNIYVKDCGCSNPALASAGSDQTICAGDTVVLNGTVNTTAIWTTNGTGNFENANAGKTRYFPSNADIIAGSVILTLKATDPDGTGPCSASSSSLTVNFEVIQITLDSLSEICVTSAPFKLSASPSGGLWSGTGVTADTFDPAVAGVGTFNLTYTVQTTNCSKKSNVSITVYDKPAVSLNPFDTLCLGDPALTLSGGSPAGGSYYLNGDLNNPITTFTPSSPGTNTITYVFGQPDCQASASMTLIVKDCNCATITTVFAGNDTVICQSSPVIQLGGIVNGVNNGMWTTSGTGLFSDASSLTSTYTPSAGDLTNGNVVLTLTSEDPDGAGPCQQVTDEMKITFEKEPEVLLLVTQPTCANPRGSLKINVLSGQNLKFSIDNGLSYTSSQIINDIDSGNYTLIVKSNLSDCQTSLDFTIEPFTSPTAKWSSKSAACNDEEYNSITLDSTTHLTLPFTVTINNNPYPQITSLPYVFNGLPFGSYNIVIKDKDGCTMTKDFTFDPSEKVKVEINSVFFVDEGDQITLNPTITGSYDLIQWTPSTYLSCDDCLNPIVKPLSNTDYLVIVTDKNGCTDQASLTIKLRKKLNVFIPNVISPNHDGINDEFTVYTDDDVELIKTLKIFNRWGGQVYGKSDFMPNEPHLGWNGTYNGNELNPAVYVFYVELLLKNGDKVIYSGDITLIR